MAQLIADNGAYKPTPKPSPVRKNPFKSDLDYLPKPKPKSKKKPKAKAKPKTTKQKTIKKKAEAVKKKTPTIKTSPKKTTAKTPKKTTVKTPTTKKSKTSNSDALEKQAIASADAYYKSQQAMLQRERDNQLKALRDNLDSAVAQGDLSKSEANKLFKEQKGEIQETAYNESQRTALVANQNGIQSSSQFIAMQQGDNVRSNKRMDSATNDRNDALTQINRDLDLVRSQYKTSVGSTKSAYSTGLIGAKADADKMKNDSLLSIGQDELNAQRDLDKMQKQHELDLAKIKYQNSLASSSYSSGGGGGGGGGYSARSSKAGKTTAGTSQAKSIAKQQASNYKGSAAQSRIDRYYQNQRDIQGLPSMAHKPILPIKAPMQNPTLSPWEKSKIIFG